jgi:hypothetical protein
VSLREIESLPGDDLQLRAIAILRAKNRLSADDAKRIEDAFAARMVEHVTTPEPVMADEPTSALTDQQLPQSPPGPTDVVKRPRGRPRRIKPAAEPSDSLAIAPKPIVDDDQPVQTVSEANIAPGKIDKSVLTISEPRRLRDKAHLKFVASQPCLICGGVLPTPTI